MGILRLCYVNKLFQRKELVLYAYNIKYNISENYANYLMI